MSVCLDMEFKVLITGSSGFIGFHLSNYLLKSGYKVVGIDNMNDYYNLSLKEARLEILKRYDSFSFHKIGLGDKKESDSLFSKYKPDYVINLAAQAGVRYSIENPYVMSIQI